MQRKVYLYYCNEVDIQYYVSLRKVQIKFNIHDINSSKVGLETNYSCGKRYKQRGKLDHKQYSVIRSFSLYDKA